MAGPARASVVSILGVAPGGAKCVALGSDGPAAPAFPLGLLLPHLLGGGPLTELELPPPEVAPAANGAASAGLANKAPQGLPAEWRQALVELQLMLACDSERQKNLRVLVLPLVFGSRSAGLLLVALPRDWSPPGAPSAGAGADAALMALSSCVAECCLGPVMTQVDQMCDAVEAASSADSLQELVSSVVAAVSTTLSSELHVDLSVRLALLPYKESPTGVLFYSTAPTAAGGAGDSAGGALPQSPTGHSGSRAPPKASASMTNLAGRHRPLPPGHQPSLPSQFHPGAGAGADRPAAAAALLPAMSMPMDFVRTSAPGTSGAPGPAAPSPAGPPIRSSHAHAHAGSGITNGAVYPDISQSALLGSQPQIPPPRSQQPDGGSRILQISRSGRRHAATTNGMTSHPPNSAGGATGQVVVPADVEDAALLVGGTGAGTAASGLAATTPRGAVTHATMPAAFLTVGHALGAAAGAVISSATAPSALRPQPASGIAAGRHSRMLLRRAITSGFAPLPGGGIAVVQPMWKAGPFNTTATLLASLLDGASGSRRNRIAPGSGVVGGVAGGCGISPATTATGMLGPTSSMTGGMNPPVTNINSGSGFVATALAAAFGVSLAGGAPDFDKSGSIGPARRVGGASSIDAGAGFASPLSQAVTAAGGAAQADVRSGGSGNGAGYSNVRLQAAVVPDVPSYLQNTSRPNADVFNVVRRAGIAGGLASLIAIVAASAPGFSAATVGGGAGAPALGGESARGVPAASGTGMAMTPRRSIHRNASADNMLYAAPGAAAGMSSVTYGNTGMDASPRQHHQTAGSVPRASRLLGQAGSVSGPALGVYIYSRLPLPASLLHVAKDRAMALMRVLAPAVLRALTAGGLLADEWAFLSSRAQTMLGVPGQQASGPAAGAPALPPCDSSTSIPPVQALSPPPAMPSGLAGAHHTCPSLPFVAATDSSVGGAPPAPVGSPQGRVASPGLVAFSHINGSAPGILSTSPSSSTAAPTRLRTGTGPNTAPRQPQQQFTSPFATGNVLSAAEVTVHDPLDCPDTPATPATGGTPVAAPSNVSQRDLAFAAACNAAGTFPDLLDTSGEGIVPGVSMGALRTQGSGHSNAHGAASRSLTGNGFVSGLGYAAAAGINSTTLLTDTITDLGGALTRQTQMATLVTAFTTTLARARKDNEQEGGAHAEDDIRALKIMRAIGQGGCSVVMLGRLHAMPVAVKVILPVGDDEDEALPGSSGGGRGGDPALQTLWSADEAADAAAKGGDGMLILPGGDDDAPGYQVRFGGDLGAVDEQSLSDDELLKRKRRRTTVRRRSQLAAMMRGARELAVLTTVSHPNIVQVYSYCTRVIVKDNAGGVPQLEVVPEGEPVTSPLCTALIMEYCDMGSLADAIDCGAFAKAARAAARAGGSSSSRAVGPQTANGLLPRRSVDVATTAGTPAMRAVYLTLLEVALALRHLHSMNLVHCDVKPANVLLRSSATDPRGFTAKLTDFGFVNLVRRQGADGGSCQVLGVDDDDEEHMGENKAPANPVGTVTHMSPELLTGAPVDSSIDVYAFGILMWEIFTGKAPYAQYADTDFVEVPAKVVKEGLRPRFPSDTPLHFKILAQECWSAQPGRRPAAPALVTRLQALLDASCS
ncbi:hypothetical protein HXX76_004370 [Chlamydomonas incerta]|uniref:Protein kinase domain-containing protein n=1 Tax=Chlamydomonas incerta TaxID=51695 RepID=A0A835T7Q7_CHLIN|nr:hypothetical protein HXX76_004370 [Chlamydomonas incerta]|eukprot:KAG2440258.1 hypothetical protein HXX76_004370 [Chlamydomonas incerta]